MALVWSFKCKAGYVTEVRGKNEYAFPFYVGNAFMITLYEYTDDEGTERYDMQWFFLDETHAKRCLGLAKNADGKKQSIFDADGITKLVIYRENCPGFLKIVELFTKAFPKIAVEILEQE